MRLGLNTRVLCAFKVNVSPVCGSAFAVMFLVDYELSEARNLDLFPRRKGVFDKVEKYLDYFHGFFSIKVAVDADVFD